MLSLAAVGVYAVAVLACLAAAMAARIYRQNPQHVWIWGALWLAFAMLIFLRLYEVEDMVRNGLRALLRAEGSYDDRRHMQGPIVVAIILLVSAGGLFQLYRLSTRLRGRRNFALVTAMVATMAMLFLIALRLISLHAIDVLLYGPLKLNWVVDIGASIAVLLAAIRYVRLVRARP